MWQADMKCTKRAARFDRSYPNFKRKQVATKKQLLATGAKVPLRWKAVSDLIENLLGIVAVDIMSLPICKSS